MRIKSIKARQIINSKGHPTLQIEASTGKHSVYSSVPLAASKSKYEFFDTYDNNLARFHGETLDTIVNNVNTIVAPRLEGKDSRDQEEIDKLLLSIDDTLTRSRLGVNTITAISQAVAKLGAAESDIPLYKYLRVLYDFTGSPHQRLTSIYKLPKPVVSIYQNFIHPSSEEYPVQEVLIFPKTSFSYLNHLIKLFDQLDKLDVDSIKATNLENFLEKIKEHLSDQNLKFFLGVDMASSRFQRAEPGEYVIPKFNSNEVNWRGDFKRLSKVYAKWVKKFNLDFLEDIFGEDDYSAWKEFKEELYKIAPSAQLVSDDFTATSVERLDKVSMLDCCNNVIIKPSQIGTVSETILFAQRARKYGHNLTVSYRHGETEDTFISDLAVGINAEFIRTGYYLGSEYTSKLNRLLQIEDEIHF